MKSRRIGVDVDGVLADFNTAFVALILQVTGKVVPLPPLTWHYHLEHITKEEHNAVWEVINDPGAEFLLNMDPLGDPLYLRSVLADLHYAWGADLYFITSRPGREAKRHTEMWLQDHLDVKHPTVLIDKGGKGPIARGLNLTHFIDDRPENIEDVAHWSPSTRVFLFDAPYNADTINGVAYKRVTSFTEFGEAVAGKHAVAF